MTIRIGSLVFATLRPDITGQVASQGTTAAFVRLDVDGSIHQFSTIDLSLQNGTSTSGRCGGSTNPHTRCTHLGRNKKYGSFWCGRHISQARDIRSV